MSYSDKFRDPRWQRKRLQIFQRDDFTCKMCKRKDITLHLHRKIYLEDNDPWDYPDEYLVTLCTSCREIEHGFHFNFQKEAVGSLLKIGLFNGELGWVTSFLRTSIEIAGVLETTLLLHRFAKDVDFRTMIMQLPEFKEYKELWEANKKRSIESHFMNTDYL